MKPPRVQAIKEFFTGPDANDYDNDSKFREMFLGPKITNRSERTSRPSQRTFFSRMATQPAQYSKSVDPVVCVVDRLPSCLGTHYIDNIF